jgi:hypothetical protein
MERSVMSRGDDATRNFIDEIATVDGRKFVCDQDIRDLWAHFRVLEQRAVAGDSAAGLKAADLIDDLADYYHRFANLIRNAETRSK